MTISYSWLCDYLPEKLDPERLSKILTSIGLEVEIMGTFESVKGGLEGLFVGEVLTCDVHENSDHLHVTTVNVGQEDPLQIVCGAPNVAAGQKVIVAVVGTTIYPNDGGEPLTMKKAKIRGVESFGMLCAADEIGVGESHDGIMVLPADLKPGMPVSEYFNVYKDIIYEIGLTANRMDAMSHIGCARDVCAYLSHHNNAEAHVKLPSVNGFKPSIDENPFSITIENAEACARYAGIWIRNVKIAPSPEWLQNKLKTIGVHPINNIVDITNFVLHEYGQPLHAFDADKIVGKHIIVKNLAEGTPFKTLDGKEVKLNAEDVMICDDNGGLCIAGVYGGAESGVSNQTTDLFLESAYFNPTMIRRTSMHHWLRTDAATHFEKGVDISNVINALKRATLLIQELAGGEFSVITDIYPKPAEEKLVCLKYHFLKKLSGKNYHPDSVKRILSVLGFTLVKENVDELWLNVPFSKADVTMPADVVEEILRIDGLDNIEIPSTITITPETSTLGYKFAIYEKTAQYLVGQGFNEILTNSITNSSYYTEAVVAKSVKMLNSLNTGLDMMRPSMLESGLEVVSYNAKRRMSNLRMFEIGKTYHSEGVGNYSEEEHLALYITGKTKVDDYLSKGTALDFSVAKGLVKAIMQLHGLSKVAFKPLESGNGELVVVNKKEVGTISIVSKDKLKQFDLKAPVCFIDLKIAEVADIVSAQKVEFKEVPKFPSVERDLALVLDRGVKFDEIEKIIKQSNLNKLTNIRLFDIFENDKLGENKKSVGINFTFLDESKTLVDKEVDAMMSKLIKGFEKNLNAEIRK